MAVTLKYIIVDEEMDEAMIDEETELDEVFGAEEIRNIIPEECK